MGMTGQYQIKAPVTLDPFRAVCQKEPVAFPRCLDPGHLFFPYFLPYRGVIHTAQADSLSIQCQLYAFPLQNIYTAGNQFSLDFLRIPAPNFVISGNIIGRIFPRQTSSRIIPPFRRTMAKVIVYPVSSQQYQIRILCPYCRQQFLLLFPIITAVKIRQQYDSYRLCQSICLHHIPAHHKPGIQP